MDLRCLPTLCMASGPNFLPRLAFGYYQYIRFRSKHRYHHVLVGFRRHRIISPCVSTKLVHIAFPLNEKTSDGQDEPSLRQLCHSMSTHTNFVHGSKQTRLPLFLLWEGRLCVTLDSDRCTLIFHKELTKAKNSL